MKMWIRWSGIVGFVVTLALLIGGWMFAAGPLVKLAIEEFGSKAAGAKVDVQSVDMSFSPLGVVVSGVQVADAEAPMKNLFEFDRAEADLQLVPLLLGKGIINHLTLTGVQLDTERQTSGALDQSANTAQDDASSNEDSTNNEPGPEDSNDSILTDIQTSAEEALPTTDEILAREPLQTVESGKAFKEAFDKHKKSINDSIAALPNEKAVKQYEQKLNAIINGRFESVEDFQQRKKEFDELKKQFKRDQKAISEARKALNNGKADLNKKWKALEGAPESDYDTLRNKYTLDGQGVANVSALLFGGETGEWTKTGLEYYEKIKPFLASEDDQRSSDSKSSDNQAEASLKPRDVHFATAQPMPDFWIKKMTFSIKVKEDDLTAVANNITSEQDVTGLPITLRLNSQLLGDAKDILIEGQLDRRGNRSIDEFTYSIARLDIQKMDLGMLGMKLQSSQMSLNGDLKIESSQLEGKGDAVFNRSSFSTKDRTIVARELTSALARIPTFNIDYTLGGKLDAPDFGMNSDLDNKLEKIFDQVLSEKRRAFEKELKAKLKERMLSYASNYEKELQQLGIQQSDLANLDKSIGDLSKKKLASFEDQKKKEAREQAKKKQKELEEKAKKRQKELEEKAKEKLKGLF